MSERLSDEAPRAAAPTAEDRARIALWRLPMSTPGRDDAEAAVRHAIREAESAAAQRAREEASAETWARCIAIARGCHDYGGGHHSDGKMDAYQHGIETVVSALSAPQGTQRDVLERVGSTAAITERVKIDEATKPLHAEVARLRDDLDIARGDERLAQAAIARLKRELAARPPWPAAKARAAEALMRAVEERTQVRFGTRDPRGMLVAEVSIPEDLWIAYYAAAGGEAGEVRDALLRSLDRFRNKFVDADHVVDALDAYLASRGLPRKEADRG